MKIVYTLIFSFLLVNFISCTKATTADPVDSTVVTNPTCDKIPTIKILATPSVITIGESTSITATNIPNVLYSWFTPTTTSATVGNYSPINLSNAGLKDRGWYYISAYSPDCTVTKKDSVYVNVKLLQGTPACTIANNTCNNTILTSETYSSITRVNSPLSLSASSSQGDLKVIFHPYWNNKEPEDGIYKTTNIPTFDPVNPDFNKVFFTMTKISIYWASWADQDVYVSHVNGKLQIRFCSLNLNGSNGSNSYTNKASANLIQN